MDCRASATDRNFRDALDCSLLMVSMVTGEPMPPEAEAQILRDCGVVALAQRSLAFASVPASGGKRPHLVSRTFYTALRSRNVRIVAYELRFLMHTESDWRELRLPDWLIPVYYVVRLAGFLRRRVMRILAEGV